MKDEKLNSTTVDRLRKLSEMLKDIDENSTIEELTDKLKSLARLAGEGKADAMAKIKAAAEKGGVEIEELEEAPFLKHFDEKQREELKDIVAKVTPQVMPVLMEAMEKIQAMGEAVKIDKGCGSMMIGMALQGVVNAATLASCFVASSFVDDVEDFKKSPAFKALLATAMRTAYERIQETNISVEEIPMPDGKTMRMIRAGDPKSKGVMIGSADSLLKFKKMAH